MRWLAAGLTLVNFATVAGLLFGIVGHGLGRLNASAAFAVGVFAAVLAYLKTSDPKTKREIPSWESSWHRYRDTWKWLVAACFVIFAVGSFCWLFYIDSDQFRIQSPNNLGDLALHITFIKNFANGVALWPDNPIFDGSKLRYPAGIDLFNALLYLQHVDLIRGLVWVGLLGSIATWFAFHRWGGTFAVAGFLFNGGLAGFNYLANRNFSDYQGAPDIAWKSIPLSMFVTQRGLLYAIPAGLLLLWHWREKFFRNNASDRNAGPVSFWIELSIYASMPLFHVHTFLALSGVLVCFAVFGDAAMRKQTAVLIGSAFLPATFLVWLITDRFHAGSVFEWHPGWVQRDGEFAAPMVLFWFKNFGLWIPLVLALLGFCGWKLYRSDKVAALEIAGAAAILAISLCVFCIFKTGLRDEHGLFRWQAPVVLLLCLAVLATTSFFVFTSPHERKEKMPEDALFLFTATAIFAFGFCVKTAPWGWDNLKLMVWSYFLILPFLWDQLIKPWPISVRVVALIALFESGFVSLLGGLAAGHPGFGFADRAEVDGVGNAVAKLPVEARFAAFPTYNHSLLLQGRKVVLGYPGHLWTEGFDYSQTSQKLTQLMNGASNWQEIAHQLQVRYIFWGREETANYSSSSRPWEKTLVQVAGGGWGAIYDLEQPATTP